MGEQHANGPRVSRHRLVADATVGGIANPMSGRDIRRLVASAEPPRVPGTGLWLGRCRWDGYRPPITCGVC
ncbi:hypothetical protein GCM10010191_70230 [Actinomadura vinacea]|uniref:Uncharacterized protein n=1 Tax=Actinomadura vinacea TaxID=115336 RepID=A0ABN3K1G7_9ACTN